MENKKSFILYADLIKVVEKLPDEIAGKLFKIVLRYVNDLEVCVDDILLEIAFEPIKNQLKRDLKKWENLKVKRSNAGKLGGRPKKENNQSIENEQNKELKKPNAFFDKQTEAKKAVNVNDNVNVTVNVNDILLEKETKEKGKRFSPPSLEEVQNFILEKKYQFVNSESFWNFYESKNWFVGKNKMKDWKKALSGWESREKEKIPKQQNQNLFSNQQQNGKSISNTSSNSGYKPASTNTEKLIRELKSDFENGNIPGMY